MRSSRAVLFGLLLFLGSASGVAAADNATTTNEAVPINASTTTPFQPRSFLHMADGNWYDPVTGLTAPFEQELLWKVYPELAPVTPPPTLPAPTDVASTTVPVVLDDFALIKAIRRGKEFLLPTVSISTVAKEPDWYEVDLAIWNSLDDSIKRVTIRKKGTEIKVLTPFDGEIRVAVSARMQSQYKVIPTQGQAQVVAVKYPFYEEIKKGKTVTYRREEVVYTPYSQTIQTPEMTRWGKEYLDNTLKDLYQELDGKQIQSAAYPDRLVTQVIHPNLPKAVMLIEQSDAKSLEQNPLESLQRFYTTIAANEDRAYGYIESPAAARGAAQFIPSTYKLLADQSEFGLNPDFASGTRSLRNSIKAEVIYLDRILATMPDDVQSKHVTNPEVTQEYLVAAYNGGEGRVKNAIAQYGDTWLQDRFSNLTALKKKADGLDAQIATSKKKVKTLKGDKLTQEKKKLTSLQSQRNTLSVQINTLNKAALRPETLEYLVKYRNAMESLNQETSVSTQAAAVSSTS